MLDLLVKARNGRKFRTERKEVDGKEGRSEKEEWRTREVMAGGWKKAGGDGKTGKQERSAHLMTAREG